MAGFDDGQPWRVHHPNGTQAHRYDLDGVSHGVTVLALVSNGESLF